MISRSPMLVLAVCAATLPCAASAKDLCGKLAGTERWSGSFTLRVSREDGDSRSFRKYSWTISGGVTLEPHVDDGVRWPSEWHGSRQEFQAAVDDLERDSQQNSVRIHLGELESNGNSAHLKLNCSKGTYRFSVNAGIWREQRKLTLSDQVEAQCARSNPMLEMLCSQVRQRGKALEQEHHTFKVSAQTTARALGKSGSLSGSEEVELGQHLQNGERLKATLSWSLAPAGQKPIQVTVEPPDDYDRWIPRGDLDEPGKAGSSLRFRLTVHEKGDPGARRKAALKVSLRNVSHEKGVCLNWPAAGEPTKGLRLPRAENRDLEFKRDDDDDGQTPEPVEKVEVVVSSHDFGAFGVLHIEGVEEKVEVRFKGKDVPDVPIPRDDNDNHIADDWEERFGGGGDRSDDLDDQPQGDGHQGDALSLYEEYRGFRISGALDTGRGELVTGKHVRTSPHAKDVFIIDTVHKGVGQFGLSGLRVHFLEREEVGASSGKSANPLCVNPNHGHASIGEQYPIVIEKGASPEDLGGAATVGLPRDCPYLQVDTSKADVLETITHELAHCTNVTHHGDEAILIKKVRVRWAYKDGTVDHPEGEETTYPEGTFQVLFDRSGKSVSSGDTQCFMHYVAAFGVSSVAQDNKLELTDQDGKTHMGFPSNRGHARYKKTRFCSDQVKDFEGKPIAKAQHGNCLAQFCVNHLKHPAPARK